jgi:hypothetical protein
MVDDLRGAKWVVGDCVGEDGGGAEGSSYNLRSRGKHVIMACCCSDEAFHMPRSELVFAVMGA